MNELLTIQDLARKFGVTVETIYDWRKRRYGPPAIKVGRRLFWDPADVQTWLDSNRDRQAVS